MKTGNFGVFAWSTYCVLKFLQYGLRIQDKLMEGTLATSLELPRARILTFGLIYEKKFFLSQYHIILIFGPIGLKKAIFSQLLNFMA